MIRKLKRTLRYFSEGRDGMALMASTLAIFVVLILLATTIVPLMIGERRMAANVVVESKASHIAHTGLERAIQHYRRTRVPPQFSSVSHNTGTYIVRSDLLNDESGTPLSWCNYVMIRSRGRVGEKELIPEPPGQGNLKYKRWRIERNMRVILSSFPHAFLFSFYSQNLDNGVLDVGGSTVNGSVYFRGNIDSSIPISQDVYTPGGFSAVTGSVTYHSDPQPPFPYLDQTPYLTLLETASGYPSGDYVLETPKGKPVFLDLKTYADNTLYVNGKVKLTQVSVKGPGRIVATDSVTIISTPFQNDIMVVSGNATQIQSSLDMGSGVCVEEDGVIIYSGGELTVESSTVYGLGISMGRLVMNSANWTGAVLALGGASPSAPNLVQGSTLVGSLVAKNNVDFSSSTLVRGPLPLAEGKDIGLEPYVIPGSWLEY
ncbi:MAG: hypothetical protein V3U24_03955 [Candidatus Neomarinimicrobiota bacterium]